MADNRAPFQTVSLWSSNPAGCTNQWVAHYDEIRSTSYAVQLPLTPGCEYYSLDMQRENRGVRAAWNGISRFGFMLSGILGNLAMGIGDIHRLDIDGREIADTQPSIKMETGPTSSMFSVSRLDSYFNSGIDAGLFVFRILPQPSETDAPMRLQDDNFGRFPAQLPSISIEY